MSQIFLLHDDIKMGSPHNETLIVLAFIVCLSLVPSVRDLVHVVPFPFNAFVKNVADVLSSTVKGFVRLFPVVLDSQPSSL